MKPLHRSPIAILIGLAGLLTTSMTWGQVISVPTDMGQHVVYLDFETQDFDLDYFGISDPNIVEQVKRRTELAVQRNYASYEVHVTPFKPKWGRYTRIVIGGFSPSVEFTNGTVSSEACIGFFLCGTNKDSWHLDQSVAFVFSDDISIHDELRGPNATPGRISNALGNIASHELGHIFGLCHADGADPESDDNDLHHLMTQSPVHVFAVVDKYFSYHVSNDKMIETVGVRNYHSPLQNVSGELYNPTADLIYGELLTLPAVIFGEGSPWYGRTSDGNGFGSYRLWSDQGAGGRTVVLLGDVDGDGAADLLEGRHHSATSTRWYALLSEGTGFGSPTLWSSDAGDLGDIFRLADVDGDGLSDLIYGRPTSSTTVRWYVRPSSASGFDNYSVWSNDGGDVGDLFYVTDVTGDGRADLVYGRAVSFDRVKWYVRPSTGSSFGSYSLWHGDAGNLGDRFLLADVDADGDSDLVYGRRQSLTRISWYVRKSTGSRFGGYSVWQSNGGNAGNLFRLGDIDGDGRADLVYAEKQSPTQWKWYGRFSDGSAFGGLHTLRNDAGDEGFLVP